MIEDHIGILSVDILKAIEDRIEGEDTGIILSAMAGAMIHVATTGMNCEPEEAILVISAMFLEAAGADLGAYKQ